MTSKILIAAAALFLLVGFVALTFAFSLPGKEKSAAPHATLTFAERVTYQRAIEDVYWRHRIWPKERLDSKPSLDELMPPEQIEQKVENYLRVSQLLGADQLQSEMERMARDTKNPEVLREIFDAFGNDPYVIAECLARPVLVEQFLSNRSAHDRTFHGDVSQRHQLPEPATPAGYKLPAISRSASGCTNNNWTPITTTNAPTPRYNHTTVWTGSEMIVWGGVGNFDSFFNTGGRYDPALDMWTATSTTNAPLPRQFHTAVWTGTEMIIWGGWFDNPPAFYDTGGKYNPAIDSWIPTSMTNAPEGRRFHTAVWTGSEMIVWGGGGLFGSVLNTGGKYNPATNTWVATSLINVPEPRWYHTAIWTGREMIIWGGYNPNNMNTGGRYDPVSDSWTATSAINAPNARSSHNAVWTGREMIIWGGLDKSGGKYNPRTDSWTATSTINVPQPRSNDAAVWTGTEMIIWGGFQPSFLYFDNGGRYNPVTNTWVATSSTNAPSVRAYPTPVWTGTEMIVWGGHDGNTFLNTGGKYLEPPSPTARTAVSRKIHGNDTHDVDLSSTECRSGGATGDHQVIVTFANPVTMSGAAVTSGTGSVDSSSVAGSAVTLNLTGVANNQTITLTLEDVQGGGPTGCVDLPFSALLGDTNGNGSVNSSDVSETEAESGHLVLDANFRSDVTVNNAINSSDVSTVQAQSGTALP